MLRFGRSWQLGTATAPRRMNGPKPDFDETVDLTDPQQK